MNRHLPALGAALAVLIVLMVGCSGGLAPTLPSPDGSGNGGNGGNGGEGGEASSTITTSSEGLLLPDGLTVENFEVTLNGEPTVVTRAVPSRDTGISICFIFDTTGSMSPAIEGVKDSIEEFATSFEGIDVWWSGMEYGDGTPSDGTNTWDFSFVGDDLVEGARTLVQPSEDVGDLQAWLDDLTAIGGGDLPENPLKALMEAKATMNWPAGVARHFIVITDIGAQERSFPPPDTTWFYPRPDGEPFSPYMGSEVLAAFRGWGIIHSVSPDYSQYWLDAEAAANSAPGVKVAPAVVVPYKGWDVRELADGGPSESRTHNGTGGKWMPMTYYERVDLNELGIAEYILQSYTVYYQVPEGTTSAQVVITASYTRGGVPQSQTFDLGEVAF